MPKPVILSHEEITSVLDMRSVIAGVEQAYAHKSAGRAHLFPLVCHVFEEGSSELDIKSGSIDGAGIFGMKLVTYFPNNQQLGLPALAGTILVFDRKSGQLEAVMDGTRITNMRTGAAGAIGAKHLARADSRNLLMVGAGMQAASLVMATLEVMEDIERLTICDPMSFEQAQNFAVSLRKRMVDEYVGVYAGTSHYDRIMGRLDIQYVPTADLRTACGEADIILTATPSRHPLLMADWIRAGTHLSCIGADMEGKQEVDELLLERAHVFADDIAQVTAVGECQTAYKQGLLEEDDITEIGDVILGVAAGRRNPDEITLFDGTGIAIQDLIVAQAVLRLSIDKGIGTRVSV